MLIHAIKDKLKREGIENSHLHTYTNIVLKELFELPYFNSRFNNYNLYIDGENNIELCEKTSNESMKAFVHIPHEEVFSRLYSNNQKHLIENIGDKIKRSKNFKELKENISLDEMCHFIDLCRDSTAFKTPQMAYLYLLLTESDKEPTLNERPEIARYNIDTREMRTSDYVFFRQFFISNFAEAIREKFKQMEAAKTPEEYMQCTKALFSETSFQKVIKLDYIESLFPKDDANFGRNEFLKQLDFIKKDNYLKDNSLLGITLNDNLTLEEKLYKSLDAKCFEDSKRSITNIIKKIKCKNSYEEVFKDTMAIVYNIVEDIKKEYPFVANPIKPEVVIDIKKPDTSEHAFIYSLKSDANDYNLSGLYENDKEYFYNNVFDNSINRFVLTRDNFNTVFTASNSIEPEKILLCKEESSKLDVEYTLILDKNSDYKKIVDALVDYCKEHKKLLKLSTENPELSKAVRERFDNNRDFLFCDTSTNKKFNKFTSIYEMNVLYSELSYPQQIKLSNYLYDRIEQYPDSQKTLEYHVIEKIESGFFQDNDKNKLSKKPLL